MEIEILSQIVKGSESDKYCKRRNTHFLLFSFKIPFLWGLQHFTKVHTPSSRSSSLQHFSITCDHVLKSKIKSTVTIFAILSIIIEIHAI